MIKKPTILVVGKYNRRDYIDLFYACKNDFNFYFVDYASRKELTSNYYKRYGQAIFWGDFRSANELLEQIKPHKVIFFFIESYYHLILNLACKAYKIPTYILDHGIRDININIKFEQETESGVTSSFFAKITRKLPQLSERLKARLFLERSKAELPAPLADFFLTYFNARSKNHYNYTFREIRSSLRVADAYIAFSPKTYQVHQYYDHLPINKPVHYIGIPGYDHLINIKQAAILKKQVLFLDQGLVERGFFGWTIKAYKEFAYNFAAICHKYGYEILVKPHPVQTTSNTSIWNSCLNTRIIDNKELTTQLPFTKLIIGFFSTYLLPLVAMPHTTVITLENHPAGKLDVSKSFIDAGVAKPVYDLQELHSILPNIEKLHQQQLPNKAKFTEEWMYKFDGKAGERLRDILLSNDL